MTKRLDDICVRPEGPLDARSRPLATPLCPSTVYYCDSPDHAKQLLTGETDGYVYSRYAHPNQQQLAEKCAELHGGERATITGSGMAALALAMVALLERGDHVVISRELYGRSIQLFTTEGARLGIESTLVDANDIDQVEAAITDRTRLVVVETITNPMLRVSNIKALADAVHGRGAQLLVDNTFASPIVCRPLAWGADFVMESITKIMNGHSDVMLGMLTGGSANWDRVETACSTWGFFASPWDCWLATRGLGTLALRIDRAADNAAKVAKMLSEHSAVESVRYPGLESHPDYLLAQQHLQHGGNMVTFTLPGGQEVVQRFMTGAAEIPFCPSLGELCTTLSHPASTSHVGLTPDEREKLDIYGGTIRLSIGVESSEHILTVLAAGLASTGRP